MIKSWIRRARLLCTTALLLLVACADGPAPRPDADRVTVQDSLQFPELPREDPQAESGDLVPPLLTPMRDAIVGGDWIAATLATPKEEAGFLDRDTAAWLLYYRARTALLRGRTADAENLLAALDETPLPVSLQKELLLHRLRQALLAGDAERGADRAFDLYSAGGHPDFSTQRCEALLWSLVQALPGSAANAARWRSWWDLARAAGLESGNDAAAAISSWQASHPEHPAAQRADQLQRAALIDGQLANAALMLPLSGPLEPAGSAVTGGVLAAYYDQRIAGPRLSVIDSRRFEHMEAAFAAARSQGAEAVLGPLGKRQVSEALPLGNREVPLITLNRPESPLASAAGVLQLSLAPEDEAALIARRAFSVGMRSALLVRPEGVWGERMEAALKDAWLGLSGQLRSRAIYGKASTHSAVLQGALSLDVSKSRFDEIRRLFREPVESSGQRRRDIDVIFLLTPNADDARSLKPLINYHYAGDIPVYAISTVDDGRPAVDNRDLDGIRMPVMPWRLGAAPPGLEHSAGDSFSALHAMGADAYHILRRAHRMGVDAGLGHVGYTAHLRVGSGGVLLRELPMAEFNRGKLRSL